MSSQIAFAAPPSRPRELTSWRRIASWISECVLPRSRRILIRLLAIPWALPLLLAGATGNAQCVTSSGVDGFTIGTVSAVEYSVTPEHGCVAHITIDPLRSSGLAGGVTPGNPHDFMMLGGFCEGRPVLDTTCPGGSRTFSFAIGELALIAFCKEGDVRWIVDKRTCWSAESGRSVEQVWTFLQEVRNDHRKLALLRAYEGFSLEVLRSPDPSAFYAKPKDTTAWFLHQVHDSSSSVTVAEYIASLDLED